MQPNFKQMSSAELKKYILSHRDELEPLRELYQRRSPDEQAIWFTPPQTQEEEQQQFDQFRHIVGSIKLPDEGSP
jgi:hypothetical protein